MGRSTYLEKIDAIKDVDYRVNSPAHKKYNGVILGKEYYRPLSFWAKAKAITEKEPMHSSVLYNRLNGKNPWDIKDALGAWKGESAAQYRKRVGDKETQAFKLDMRSSVINTWLYRSVNEG